VSVLGHTRWASVGIISEANCHPSTATRPRRPAGETRPYVVAALNGDVDNHADVKVAFGLRIPGPITTDAKVIPAGRRAHAVDTGGDLVEAFRRSVAGFDGSVAIAAATADRPTACSSRSAAAARGCTSARRGPVHRRQRAVRDGRGDRAVRPRRRRDAGTRREPQSRGQVVVLDGITRRGLGGVLRPRRTTGTPLPCRGLTRARAGHTRDIDRGTPRTSS
jgi:glucosamine--fructose-6-phosphate aminotransferase (isomerizing)